MYGYFHFEKGIFFNNVIRQCPKDTSTVACQKTMSKGYIDRGMSYVLYGDGLDDRLSDGDIAKVIRGATAV